MGGEMAESMEGIIEQYNLQINFREETPDGVVITASQGDDIGSEEAYAVFTDICETVYGCEPADADQAFISPIEGKSAISWTDV